MLILPIRHYRFLNTLMVRQNGPHFTDNILNWFSCMKNVIIIDVELSNYWKPFVSVLIHWKSITEIYIASSLWGVGWGCEVSCGGHHQPRGKTTTGSISSGWSSVWHRSNTGLSSTQYEQIPIILGVWPFWLTPFFFRSITFWRAYG